MSSQTSSQTSSGTSTLTHRRFAPRTLLIPRRPQVTRIDFTSDSKNFNVPYLLSLRTRRSRLLRNLQNFKSNISTIDLTRMAGFALFGLIVKGFIQFYYYGFLIDKITKGNCVLSTMFDQFIYVPTLYYPLYFVCTGLFQGRSVVESLRYYRDGFWGLCAASVLFWSPIQILNFMFGEDVRSAATKSFLLGEFYFQIVF